MRKEHEAAAAGRIIPILDGDDDFGVVNFGDDNVVMLPDAEPFSTPGSDNGSKRQLDPKHVYSDQTSSESAEAPHKRRKPKAQKQLALDQEIELRNTDLLTWQHEYADNMTACRLLKLDKNAKAQAKINAFSFVYGAGFNDVGNGVGLSRIPSPLDMFSGVSLLAKITGEPGPLPQVSLSPCLLVSMWFHRRGRVALIS